MSVWDLAADGKLKEIEELLKNDKSEVNKVDRGYKNWTPLHHAVRYDNIEVVEKLIENGANLEAKDVDKETPLHVAARNRCKRSVVKLVEKGANVKARNKRFQEAKTVASENNNVDIRDYLDDPSKGMRHVDNIYNGEDDDGSKSNWSFN